jgi:hypothetical protein
MQADCAVQSASYAYVSVQSTLDPFYTAPAHHYSFCGPALCHNASPLLTHAHIARARNHSRKSGKSSDFTAKQDKFAEMGLSQRSFVYFDKCIWSQQTKIRVSEATKIAPHPKLL